jgi:phosphoheptose isomerase
LLDTITRRWSFWHHVPVFVSEGTSHQKVAAIRRSHYLTNVYEKALPALGEGLVVYGWSFDKRDQHVLEAIAISPPKRMTVSVFTGQSKSDQQSFCHHVLKAAGRSLPDTAVTFFDLQSTGCWNNP